MNTNFDTPFLPILGLVSRVKPSLRYLHWSVRTPVEKPKVRYVSDFNLAFLHVYMSIFLPLFITPFWVAVRGKAKLLLSNFRNYFVLKQIISLKLIFNGWVLILTVVRATKNWC